MPPVGVGFPVSSADPLEIALRFVHALQFYLPALPLGGEHIAVIGFEQHQLVDDGSEVIPGFRAGRIRGASDRFLKLRLALLLLGHLFPVFI